MDIPAPLRLPARTDGFLFFEYLRVTGQDKAVDINLVMKLRIEELNEGIKLGLNPEDLLETAILNHSKTLLPERIKK